MSFEERLRRAAQFFEQLPEPILILGHLDTDGLAATTIITQLLDKKNKEYVVEILPQISPVFLENIPESNSIIVLDGGSTYAFTKPTLVIDHHQQPVQHENVFLLNPLLDGFDGTKEACAATLAWMLAKELGEHDQAPLAVLGAVGDNQDKPSLTGLNNDASVIAKEHGLTTLEAPQLFGVFSEPLDKLLFKSYDIGIRGITRSKKGIRVLLKQLDINSKSKYCDISHEKQQELLRALEKRKGASIPLITHYALPFPGVLRDAKKAATFINACGRLDTATTALATLRKEPTTPPETILEEYRKTLNKAMKQYEQHVYVKNQYRIFLAKDMIPPAIAGTVCSIVTRSRMVAEGTIVVALARYKNGLTKVSVRARDVEDDLFALVERATNNVGGECGGHSVAAGAIIHSTNEERFVELLCTVS